MAWRIRYQYDFESNVIRTEFPNGTEELRTCDALNRLRSVRHLDPADAVFASFDYELDNLGNRTAVTEHDGRRVEYIIVAVAILKSAGL